MSEAERARVRRHWLAVLAPGLLLGAILLWRNDHPPDITTDDQASSVDAPEFVSDSDELLTADGPAPSNSLINLTGVLIAHQQVQPVADQALIGLGYFDPEDLQEYRLIGDSDPQLLADLAVIDRWVEIPLSIAENGNAGFQLDQLPQADVYRLVAKGTGSGFYFAYQFSDNQNPSLDFGEVYAQQGASLTVRLTGPENVEAEARPRFPVFFQRGQAGDQWRLARQLFNPDVESVLYGNQRFAVGDSIVLFPLTPNQSIQVSVDGKAGQTVVETTAPLPAGERTELLLSVAELMVEQAFLVTLTATIKDESGEPISTVQLVDHPDQQTVCSASDLLGRCRLADISAEQISYFMVLIDTEKAAELAVPERYSVSFDPANSDLDAILDSGNAQVDWVIPSFRQLVLDHSALPVETNLPFPIFAIQQQNQQGHWVTINAEQFDARSNTEMVITVRDDGVYRGQAALSPWQVMYSNAVTITAGKGEQFAVLQPGQARQIELNINDAATGLPAEQIFVTVASEFSEAPSSQLLPPEPGRLALEVEGVERLSIEVYQSGAEPQEFEIDTSVDEPIELLINTNQ